MPDPNPSPEVGQLLTVSEITLVSYSDVKTAVSADSDQAVSDEKWLRTLDDIDSWEAGTYAKQTKTKKIGDIEFFENKAEDDRLAFRNKVRRRYGFSPLDSETDVPEASELDEVASLRWY